jgi:hypothetical protein
MDHFVRTLAVAPVESEEIAGGYRIDATFHKRLSHDCAIAISTPPQTIHRSGMGPHLDV